MPEPCSAKCPNYDARRLRQHSRIKLDDPELLAAIVSFAEWFYAPGQDLEEQVHYAAELYTRRDHDGTCVPKTILFAHYKHLQFTSYGEPLQPSEAARAALRGETVASWPDGELASGATWNEIFGVYSSRYE